jgi:hypothetical protein
MHQARSTTGPHGADACGMMCVAYEAPIDFGDDEDDWQRQGSNSTRSATTGD